MHIIIPRALLWTETYEMETAEPKLVEAVP